MSELRLRRWRGWRRAAAVVLASVAAATAAAAQGRTPVALHVVRDTAMGEVVLIYGPMDLPPNEMPDSPVRSVALPVDGWIHGYRVELVDSTGRELPQRLLHHVNVILPQKRELFSQIMLRLAAAGAETPPVDLPSLLGVRVHPGDSLVVSAMLHNPTTRPYSGVRLLVHLPFRPAGGWLSSLDIYPFYLDVMPPAGSHSFDVPPGHSSRSWEGKPSVPGRILGVSGHLHRYGTALRLEDVTTGDVLWDGRPVTDSTGEIVGFPEKRFYWTLGVPLDSSHVYRLTAVYDNPTGHTIVDGGMGALGGAFLPAHGATWPAVAPANAEYELDRELMFRLIPQPGSGDEMRGMHGMHTQR